MRLELGLIANFAKTLKGSVQLYSSSIRSIQTFKYMHTDASDLASFVCGQCF